MEFGNVYEMLTKRLDSIGARPDKPGLGFKVPWATYLNNLNIHINGHEIVIDNENSFR